jgi:alginate O-acetyltransferase complex protein AlgJ
VNQQVFHSGNERVLYADSGMMFYRDKTDGDMLRQSAGALRRDDQVAATADFAAEMKAALAARKISLLVASPPNSATIYEDWLPGWARNYHRLTEYDLFLSALAARGVKAIDLRSPLRDAKAHDQVFRRYDTHWTPRGALVAFNAIAAVAHSGWKVDASAALSPPREVKGGDLASMLGILDDVSEPIEGLSLPNGRRDQLSPGPSGTFSEAVGRPGPTIMVIGDSFTQDFFAPMILQHAAKVVWLNHLRCGFDWKWIDQFRPNEVWWMPTERYLTCASRPAGFPATAAQMAKGPA